jgi:hypothetical protein|nr:MAG TPA: hypothetical protein [Caudoviricetes sp.]
MSLDRKELPQAFYLRLMRFFLPPIEFKAATFAAFSLDVDRAHSASQVMRATVAA